jgi:hypothetical protein
MLLLGLLATVRAGHSGGAVLVKWAEPNIWGVLAEALGQTKILSIDPTDKKTFGSLPFLNRYPVVMWTPAVEEKYPLAPMVVVGPHGYDLRADSEPYDPAAAIQLLRQLVGIWAVKTIRLPSIDTQPTGSCHPNALIRLGVRTAQQLGLGTVRVGPDTPEFDRWVDQIPLPNLSIHFGYRLDRQACSIRIKTAPPEIKIDRVLAEWTALDPDFDPIEWTADYSKLSEVLCDHYGIDRPQLDHALLSPPTPTPAGSGSAVVSSSKT